MTALVFEEALMPPAPANRRINFMTTEDQHKWLTQARFQDHLSTSLRIRSLIELVREDPELAQRVLLKASELEQERAGSTDE